jgi:hypothetical protein
LAPAVMSTRCDMAFSLVDAPRAATGAVGGGDFLYMQKHTGSSLANYI